MYQGKVILLLAAIVVTINAQTVNVGGIVSNKAGKPVDKAVVTLVRQKMSDTTGTDGKYSFVATAVAELPAIGSHDEGISMLNGVMRFTLGNSSPVTIKIFDVKGNLLKREEMKDASAGTYHFNIVKNCPATNLLVVKASIGEREVSFPYMALGSGTYSLKQSVVNGTAIGRRLATAPAIVDTIIVTAAGFQAKSIAITSYVNQQQNITLDSNVNGGKNPPGPSAGCGKELADLKSGYYTITSASLSRHYYLSIPADYDKDKPCRLIFAMHYMMGSDTAMVSQKFYELKTYADDAKVPVIFIAPQGYTDSSPWRINDDKDHLFFDDMLKLFKEKLCVDTTRVFSCGFSYGAMVTYSLSLNHQKQLRAVACYAPANWNIYLPTNTREPIAFYSTTGTTDNLCKYINSDAKKEGGKYCVLQHIEDNGCTVPATIPTATGTTHISTEFSGCREGYPVVFGSFQGGHSNSVKDPGSSVNWIAKETWDFFMRF